jgi:glycosyltransferase involved in cell wall biosynthesis
MAALINKRAVVTNLGRYSEAIWAEGAVAVAPEGDASAFVQEVGELLHNSERREYLGRRAAALYEAHFAIKHTVDELVRTGREWTEAPE